MYPSLADALPSSGSALSAKLLTGSVSGVRPQRIDRITPPHDIGNIFGHYGDCEVDPPEYLMTGLGSPEVASQAKGEVATAATMSDSDTSSFEKHRRYAQRCSSANGTVGSTPFTMDAELLPEPDIEGTSDVVATTTIWHDDGASTTGTAPRLIVVSDNVGGINVVVRTRLPSGDLGFSAKVVREIFKAQVEKLNS